MPSFDGLKPASAASSHCKRKNRSSGTRHERLLRSALLRRGLQFRKNDKGLVGCPDIVFAEHHVVVFCDGEFWHGRNWARRLRRLRAGANASYWSEKIRANMLRDRRQTRTLRRQGWHVVRLWETDILADPEGAAARVEATLRRRSAPARDRTAG